MNSWYKTMATNSSCMAILNSRRRRMKWMNTDRCEIDLLVFTVPLYYWLTPYPEYTLLSECRSYICWTHLVYGRIDTCVLLVILSSFDILTQTQEKGRVLTPTSADVLPDWASECSRRKARRVTASFSLNPHRWLRQTRRASSLYLRGEWAILIKKSVSRTEIVLAKVKTNSTAFISGETKWSDVRF